MMRFRTDYIERIRLAWRLDAKWQRDLFWICTSPAMHENAWDSKYNGLLPKIGIDQVFERIQTAPNKCVSESIPSVLGKYAEHTLAIGLDRVFGLEILARNIQTSNSGITSGELDFLLKKGEKYFHLEYAHKYYIHGPSEIDTQLIGPNGLEQWKDKRDKLVKVQSQYHHKLDENSKWSKFSWIPKILIHGENFKKSKESERDSECWACHRKDLNEFLDDNERFSLCQNKLEWIFPFQQKEFQLNKSSLLEKIDSSNHPFQMVSYDPMGNPRSRGFVLSDSWPKSIN